MPFESGLDWQEEVKLGENYYLDWYLDDVIPFVFFEDGIIYKKNGEDRTHCRLLRSLQILSNKKDFYYNLSQSNRIQGFNISENSRKKIDEFFLAYYKKYGDSKDDLGVFIRSHSKLVFGRCWTSDNVIAFWNTKGKIKQFHINLLLKAFNLDLGQSQIFCKNVSKVSASEFLKSKSDSKNVKKVEELISKLHTISCSKSVPEGFGSKMIKGNIPIEQYRQLRYANFA